MNVKSLLLGSAAAVAAASGAQAADPVVVIEPVAPNYVEVCDTFGAGFFYIPGTETCLDIGGYVRFQVSALSEQNPVGPAYAPSGWDVFTKAQLDIASKTETELGVLTGVIKLNAEVHSAFDTDTNVHLDQTYLALGGFQAGYFQSYWDEGLLGEIDDLSGQTKFNSMRYVFTGDGFVAGLSVDALTGSDVGYEPIDDNLPRIGVSGRVGFQAGGVGMKLDGGYDTYNEEGSLRAMTSLAFGPGALDLGASWASGYNAYANSFNNWFDDYQGTLTPSVGLYAEWQLAAGYALDVTDKFTVTPAIQWTSVNIPNNSDKSFYTFGALFEYEIVDGLSAKVNFDYADLPDSYFEDDTYGGWFRLQRDF